MVIYKLPLVCKESKQVLKGTCTNPHLQVWYFESLAVSGYSKSTCICRYKGWAWNGLRDAISQLYLCQEQKKIKLEEGANYEYIQKNNNSQNFINYNWNVLGACSSVNSCSRHLENPLESI